MRFRRDDPGSRSGGQTGEQHEILPPTKRRVLKTAGEDVLCGNRRNEETCTARRKAGRRKGLIFTAHVLNGNGVVPYRKEWWGEGAREESRGSERLGGSIQRKEGKGGVKGGAGSV